MEEACQFVQSHSLVLINLSDFYLNRVIKIVFN